MTRADGFVVLAGVLSLGFFSVTASAGPTTGTPPPVCRDSVYPLALPAGSLDHASAVLVAQANRLLGAITLADVLRPEAVHAVSALREMGIHTA